MTPVQVTWTQNKRYFVVLVKIFGFETFRIVHCSLHLRHFKSYFHCTNEYVLLHICNIVKMKVHVYLCLH